MNNMVTKLSSVAALLGVVGAIGAGFVQYGKVMAKIDELDNRKAVINETVDLSNVNNSISGSSKYFVINWWYWYYEYYVCIC